MMRFKRFCWKKMCIGGRGRNKDCLLYLLLSCKSYYLVKLSCQTTKNLSNVIYFCVPILFFAFIHLATRYWQDIFIFRPKTLPKNFHFRANFPLEEITLTASEGGKLNGLLLKNETPKGLILYFHGNAGSLERWEKIMEELLPLGWDILIFDYRGYGKSTGHRNESLMFQDAERMYNWAKKSYLPSNIIIYGRSIGSAMATYLASKMQPPKLILETPFLSMSALFHSYYPFIPQIFSFKYAFRSDLYIQKVNCPILIFHGTEDRVVPYSQGIKLYDLVSNQAKLITFVGGSHHNCMRYPAFWAELKLFLAS